MVKRLSVSGIREEDLIGSTSATDLEILQREVCRTLYGIEPMCYPCRAIKDLLRRCCSGSSWSILDSPEMKDFAAPVNAEAYIEMRMAPLKKHYSSWVRSISRVRMMLHCTLMLILSISVGLGATDLAIWIPVSLGLATFVTNLRQWLSPLEILGAVNNALTMLHKLDLHWQGSDIRENRSERTKQRLISVTESVVLAVERAASQATTLAEIIDDADQESDGEDHADEALEDKRERRSRPISVCATPKGVPGMSGTVTPLSLRRH